MPKKTLSFTVPEDTYERFEAYRETRTATPSKSAAGRRIFEYGLDVAFASSKDRVEVVAEDGDG